MSLMASRRDWLTKPNAGPTEGRSSRTWAVVRECSDFTARCAGYMAFLGGLLLALHLIVNVF